MNDHANPTVENKADLSKPVGPWPLLRAVLAVELFGAAALTVLAVRGMQQEVDEPVQDLLALVIMAVLGLAWVLFALVGSLKHYAWSRAAALTLQVSVFAISLGVFQGLIGTKALGVALLLVSVIGFIAALKVRPVITEPSI